MTTYISILRGINVSGKNLIKMDALKKMYEDLNFTNVKTYIQSGNVIFNTTASSIRELEKIICTKIIKIFGFEVPIMVIELSELNKILLNNPFVNDRKEDIAYLHVTFLSSKPSAEAILSLQAFKFLPDEYIISERVVYVFCPSGYGNTKINNNFFEKKLKVSATTRNWKTTNELVKIASENEKSE